MAPPDGEHRDRMAAASRLMSALDHRLAQRDRNGAVTLALHAVTGGDVSVLDLYDLVLGPLLVGTGARWQHGSLRVWEEHYASATVRTIVEALAPTVITRAASTPRAERGVLLACPPHEHHDLGLRMLADRFALSGWDVAFLGMDTPVDEICAAATTLDTELVVLTASTHLSRVQLRDTVDCIKADAPGVQVVVGGPAFALDQKWPAEELLDYAAFGLPVPPIAPAPSAEGE